jgi:predicted HAD superfamily Cof-like phosphohydrolase
MKNLFSKVGEFNKAFNVPEQKKQNPNIPDLDRLLYYKLTREENEEYLDAVIARDMVEVADALTDELYILIGKFRKHGIDSETAQKLFDEVHRSNMSKLDQKGKPILREDGKVLKGSGYFKPDIKGVL